MGNTQVVSTRQIDHTAKAPNDGCHIILVDSVRTRLELTVFSMPIYLILKLDIYATGSTAKCSQHFAGKFLYASAKNGSHRSAQHPRIQQCPCYAFRAGVSS